MWTSIEDDLPPVGKPVLVAIPGRVRPLVAKYDGACWRIMYGSRCSWDVTHWCELPELPYEHRRTRTTWHDRAKT